MTPREKYSPNLENIEIELLLQAIHHLHGVDLREHSGPPVRRRIWEAIKRERSRTVSGLQEKLLHDPEALVRFLKTVIPPYSPVSPEFLLKFRTDLIPVFRTYPFIRIWQIGCGSVFETYSLAIALLEEGVYDRCVIYSTDANEAAIQQCHDGGCLGTRSGCFDPSCEQGRCRCNDRVADAGPQAPSSMRSRFVWRPSPCRRTGPLRRAWCTRSG